jgi:acetyl esterase/lipase
MGKEKEVHYAFPFEIPSAKTDHIKRKMFDLPYANLSEAQKLDIYWPEDGDGPFPVIVSIHGGAFMGGDKRDVQLTPMLRALKRGYCVVGVNYRMSGEAHFPALVHDIKAVIRWIRANAELYLFDPNKIATWGGSAGGYQSLMAGVSTNVPELADLSLGNPNQPCDVQAVVAWFPPTDFLKMDEQLADSDMAPPEEFSHSGSNSPESLLLGNKITLIPDLVRSANPETYIHTDVPPFFIQHGTKDNIVPHQQSVNFASKVREIAGDERVTLELIEGAGHGDPKFELVKNVNKVLDFLDQHLK